MGRVSADIIREYGPFPGVNHVHGVTYDGHHVWIATGDSLTAVDPATGTTPRSIDVAAHAGTAFDGRHLFQIAEDRIQKIDPATGRVLATIPAPGGGGDSGLAWADGFCGWGNIGNARFTRSIPTPARFFARSNPSFRHGRDVGGWRALARYSRGRYQRRPSNRSGTGAVLERLELPPGMEVSGLESDGRDRFFTGGGRSGTVRAIRRPRRRPAEE